MPIAKTPQKTKQQKEHSFFKGFVYAWQGIRRGFSTEFNLRLHLLVAMLVALLGWLCQLSTYEWLIIIFCFSIVPTIELINSAIEETCDKLRDDLGLPFAATKWPRDLAAGAVLWSALGSAIIGVIIFLPKLIVLFT